MLRKPFYRLGPVCLALLVSAMAIVPLPALGQDLPPSMRLSQAIEMALAADLDVKSSQEGVGAALSAKKAQRSYFFPTFNTTYDYKHYDTAQFSGSVMTYAQDQATFSVAFIQPLFTGFVLENSYRLAELGLDVAKVQERLIRQDVTLKVQQAYFNVLKYQKLLGVARDTVTQIDAQRTVAENFYKVGMRPLNHLLEAQVELANAKQALLVAQNNLDVARSNFNTVLRRPIGQAVFLEDILEYAPFIYDLDYCQATAEENRLEAQIADLQVDAAQKEIAVAKGEYYPTVNLSGVYYRSGDDLTVDGGRGISDPEGWYIGFEATWDFWQWGRAYHGVAEKQRNLLQTEYAREALRDQIRLEVKQTYLNTRSAEQNIKTAETAIEQAKENFRINQEQYKEQLATSTDVLTAQTLLTQTMTNYYNALYDFQLSKAALYRSMGREYME